MRRRAGARLITVTAKVHKEKGKWGRTRSLSLRNSLVSKKTIIKDNQAINTTRGIQNISLKDIHPPRKSRLDLIAEDTHTMGTILSLLLRPTLLKSLTATLMDCSPVLCLSSRTSLRWRQCLWSHPTPAVQAWRVRRRPRKKRSEDDAVIAKLS